MGEKNIIGGDGTLYMQDPDGLGWHAVERTETIPEMEFDPAEWPLSSDEIAVVQFQEAVANLRVALVESFRPVVDWATKLVETLAGVFTTWSQNFVFVRAYAWATQARPEWVRILNRTKKQRTRKKYQDRILRAYLESKEG